MMMSESDVFADLVRQIEQLKNAGGLFLTDAEIVTLTGRKAKGRQIEALRKMGVAFLINATGHPVVARSAVEGGKTPPQPAAKAKWVPKVLNTGK